VERIYTRWNDRAALSSDDVIWSIEKVIEAIKAPMGAYRSSQRLH
jgi:hypothetical protein